MKGILFGGCSFTWGQGLYFYSTLPNLKYPENEDTFVMSDIRESHIKFKNALYYPRLVANYFNTFEVFKDTNGGSEDETFDFFNSIFRTNKFSYEDFDYMIIQISNLWRNKFYYDDDNPEKFMNVHVYDNQSINKYYPEFLYWVTENNVSLEDCILKMKSQQIDRLKKEIQFYEKNGLKVKLLLWPTDLVENIKNDIFFNDRIITFKYNQIEYFTIKELQNANKEMVIKTDFDNFQNIQPLDHHPSKLCHKIIAKNIIDKIKKDLK